MIATLWCQGSSLATVEVDGWSELSPTERHDDYDVGMEVSEQSLTPLHHSRVRGA